MTRHRPYRKEPSRKKPPPDPDVKPRSAWLSDNRAFYSDFCEWLKQSSYSVSTLRLYSVVAQLAIGYLDKPYWILDPDADLGRFWQHLQERPLAEATKSGYHKGVIKLAQYLRLRLHRPSHARPLHWDYYLNGLPAEIAQSVQGFLHLAARSWPAERRHELSISTISRLTHSLRWFAARRSLERMADLTPAVWFDYVDERLQQGIKPVTLNGELFSLQHFILFLADQDHSICERMLRVEPMETGQPLHRDVIPEQLVKLQTEIRKTARSTNRGLQRAGRMDWSWFLLMLHGGLRTREVRQLRFQDLNLAERRVFIEQSKGFKDRIVFLSQAAVEAIQAYLEVRGPKDALPEQVFIYAHKPLSRFYCGERLYTYGHRCGVAVTPHQLRHSAATLLLNAGAPVITVQLLLGHKYVDTTLRYARLYDGTVAADYYQAMAVVERRLALPEDRLAQPPSIGQLIAMTDALRQGALNAAQIDLVQQLHNGLAALAERENPIEDVKVPSRTG